MNLNIEAQRSKLILKVPKRENFSLAFFAQREPTWVCNLGSGEKIKFFIKWPLFSMVFGFLPHTECAVNQKKFEARPELKVGGGCFWAHLYVYNAFFEKKLSFGSFMNV